MKDNDLSMFTGRKIIKLKELPEQYLDLVVTENIIAVKLLGRKPLVQDRILYFPPVVSHCSGEECVSG